MRYKPVANKQKPGPPKQIHGGKQVNVLMGERERALMRLYASRHLGGSETDTSAILRWFVELACAEFTEAEIEAEVKKLAAYSDMR